MNTYPLLGGVVRQFFSHVDHVTNEAVLKDGTRVPLEKLS